MTRKDLLKTLFPEVDTNTCAILKCSPNGCNACQYKYYWDEPAIVSATAVKSILNSIYGNATKELKYFDTDSMLMQYAGRGEGKAYAQHLELIQQGWTKFPSLHNNMDWSMLKDIIDDALDNGFEVNILNGTIYYRERQ